MVPRKGQHAISVTTCFGVARIRAALAAELVADRHVGAAGLAVHPANRLRPAPVSAQIEIRMLRRDRYPASMTAQHAWASGFRHGRSTPDS
jgi:hypothetical protein